jgi:transcription elongation factor Elf1
MMSEQEYEKNINRIIAETVGITPIEISKYYCADTVEWTTMFAWGDDSLIDITCPVCNGKMITVNNAFRKKDMVIRRACISCQYYRPNKNGKSYSTECIDCEHFSNGGFTTYKLASIMHCKQCGAYYHTESRGTSKHRILVQTRFPGRYIQSDYDIL